MFKYFTANGTRKYIDVLQDLVSAYNSTYHRTIKTEPVNAVNSKRLFQTVYKVKNLRDLYTNKSFAKLKPNDLVRKSNEKTPFDKSYYPNWTDQTYNVQVVNRAQLKPYYIIENRRHYPEQLQKIKDNNVYRVEKILQRKTQNGRLMYFVKWLGYPSSQNSWVNATEVIRMGQQ